MNQSKFKKLFELAEEVYDTETKKAHGVPIPYAFAKDGKGRLIVICEFSEHSKRLEELLPKIGLCLENRNIDLSFIERKNQEPKRITDYRGTNERVD